MRLADLPDLALGSLARVAARKHCEQLCAALGTSAATLPVTTPLEAQVDALVAFAKDGSWARDEDVHDVMRGVYAVLYGTASVPANAIPRAWLASENDSMALVMRVCFTRTALTLGIPVPRQGLASLADCVEKTVRNAITDGELVCVEGERLASGGKTEQPVTAESARAWLEGRRVAGFEGPPIVVEDRQDGR